MSADTPASRRISDRDESHRDCNGVTVRVYFHNICSIKCIVSIVWAQQRWLVSMITVRVYLCDAYTAMQCRIQRELDCSDQ